MRLINDFGVVGIFVMLMRCSASSINICQQYGADVVLHTSYKDDGVRSCCRIVHCSAGFQAVMCSPDDPFSTYCEVCPPNTFQSDPTSSVDMKYCEVKQTCSAGMREENGESTTEDRRCLCDVERGLCQQSRNRSTKCWRRSCPVGKELNQDCSCTECLDGFFKDVNDSMPCRPWTDCRAERRKVVTDGTTTTDAVCGNFSYDNRGRGALTLMDLLKTTPSLSASSSTSDLPTTLSSESSQNSSDPHHTTSQNENSQGLNPLIPVAIAAGIIAVAAIFAVIFMYPVYRREHRYDHCKMRGQPAQLSHADDGDDKVLPRHDQPLVQFADAPNAGRQEHEHLLQPVAEDDEPQPPHPNFEEEDATVNRQRSGDGGHSNLPDGREQEEEEKEDATVVNRPTEPAEGPCMTRAMEENLRNNRVTLVKRLNVDTGFLAVLCINNTITDDIKQEIQAETTPNKKNDRLLDHLLRRPAESYNTFILALVDSKQSHLAHKIDAKLTAEYNAYVESGGSVEDKVRSFGRL